MNKFENKALKGSLVHTQIGRQENHSHTHLSGILVGETGAERLGRMIFGFIIFAASTMALFLPGSKLMQQEANLTTGIPLAIPGWAEQLGLRPLIEHLFSLPLKKDYFDVALASEHAHALDILGACAMMISGLYVLLVIYAEWSNPSPKPSFRAAKLWWGSKLKYNRSMRLAAHFRECSTILQEICDENRRNRRREIAAHIMEERDEFTARIQTNLAQANSLPQKLDSDSPTASKPSGVRRKFASVPTAVAK